MEKKKRLICIFTVLIGIVLIVASFKSHLIALLKDYEIVTARATSTINYRKSTNYNYHYKTFYTFEVNNEKIEDSDYSNKHLEDEDIKIYYNKNNVKDNGIVQIYKIALIIGSIFTLLGVIFLVKKGS